MTIEDDDELCSLDYAEFVHKYKNIEDSGEESVKKEPERGTKDAEEQHESGSRAKVLKSGFVPSTIKGCGYYCTCSWTYGIC
jgi:hypothetical protein